MTAVSYTWRQIAVPLTVGTVHFTVNQDTNQTVSTTIIDAEHEALVSSQIWNGITFGVWTRTDVNAAGTVTTVIPGFDGPTVV